MQRVRKLIVLTALAGFVMACSLFPSSAGQSAGSAPTAAPQQIEPTAEAPTQGPQGTVVEFPGGRLTIPPGLASGANVEAIPAVAPDESQPWWEVAPAHVKLSLQGYMLLGKFHEPQIVVYPAEEYVAMNESVASNLDDLRQLIANPAGAAVPGAMPGVPFFNAGAVMSAQTAPIDFPGGQGIRAVTQYSQFYSQVNNQELFYLFHGLTADGKTYAIAVLPVTAPALAPDGAESSQPPAGGVPFPGFDNIDAAVFETYYRSVTDLLNGTPGDQFQPTLAALDALIQSLEVTR